MSAFGKLCWNVYETGSSHCRYDRVFSWKAIYCRCCYKPCTRRRNIPYHTIRCTCLLLFRTVSYETVMLPREPATPMGCFQTFVGRSIASWTTYWGVTTYVVSPQVSPAAYSNDNSFGPPFSQQCCPRS